MSAKHEVSISAKEREDLVRLVDAEIAAANKVNRAQHALQACQLDKAEFIQGLQKRYKLRDADTIDNATGAITRKPLTP